ncbi:LysM peptidoglycan-binding domain-containing protein [Weissella sagaensis]|uniref:LysM peptidoglycan-binding domain-containing protein n=1 Tax=Weissella sagaensis TaxID=2559928 RepID=A0ABW1RSQ4_9LACO|nr:LysM peptidoglycan-binding domain-containing protein [Weissella sagaensis]
METKSHKKMYKAGKQWAAVAVATTAAGVAFISSNESASADVWQANTVDQVASQVTNNGGVNNYQVQLGDTVWALAMATNNTVDNFAAVNGIVNPDLIVAGQHFNGSNTVAPVASSSVNQQTTQTAYEVTPSADEIAASQAAADEAVAASQAAQSQAAASQAAASQAYAASVAASQAQAASMAAAESNATAASEAAAKAAESQAIAETAKANAAAQSAQSASVANDAAAANASAAASQSAATAQQAQSSQTSASATTAGNVDNATFNALKSMRSGMTTEWSSDLAAQAQARAQQIANAGRAIPNEHWSNPNEVISIGFGSGSSVVDAWYNETNMTTASGTGHRDWEMRAGSTHFGFAQVGDVIVGVSR